MRHGSPVPILRRVTLGPAAADPDARLMIVDRDYATTLAPGKVYSIAYCPDLNGQAVLFIVDHGPVDAEAFLGVEESQ